MGVIAPAACNWTALSNNTDWLSITSSGNAGTSDANFVAAPNTNAAPRMGTLTIAGQTYTVTEAGAGCSYTLGTSSVTASSAGAPGSFTFTANAAGCSPNAQSFAAWIGTSTAFSGTSGTVSFAVAPNASAVNRNGTIQLGDQTFTVNQTGAQCGFSLQAYGAAFPSAGGMSATTPSSAMPSNVVGSPSAIGCNPVVGVDQPSIVSLTGLSGPVSDLFTETYNVNPFTGALTPTVRVATITFGGQLFFVKQTSN